MISGQGRECERQYRLVKFMLSAHSLLRDRYQRRSTIADVILVVCSAGFCATAFSGGDLFDFLGTTKENGRIVLGIASTIAFAASLAVLVLDWRGSASRYADAAQRWELALQRFREARATDKSWPPDVRKILNDEYWDAHRASHKIPDRLFSGLTAAHRRKIAISQLLDKYTHCPVWLLSMVLRARDSSAVLKRYLQRNSSE